MKTKKVSYTVNGIKRVVKYDPSKVSQKEIKQLIKELKYLYRNQH